MKSVKRVRTFPFKERNDKLLTPSKVPNEKCFSSGIERYLEHKGSHLFYKTKIITRKSFITQLPSTQCLGYVYSLTVQRRIIFILPYTTAK